VRRGGGRRKSRGDDGRVEEGGARARLFLLQLRDGEGPRREVDFFSSLPHTVLHAISTRYDLHLPYTYSG